MRRKVIIYIKNFKRRTTMLEIKNVSKTYRPKKGVPVKALDDVSLKFEDRGMVFILGKSGSGKSTLLNVLGGLDQADEGEFIIKGKSSKDFTQSDFDSYRNTFIGFIFQEYNILSEFTVGANIALAMELQGQKATSEALNEILDEVDLTGYGNRKPNELSGGQKQRVAIARALIKKPEMIMADEPTGALDSNTGKQVFDTLKKLSKEKLVLIVSHDRDFAELYADRIIELKDGKVISDVSKTSVMPESVSEGVSVVDDKLIHIKKGYKLTEKDLKLINDYISKAEGDTLISVDEEKNVEIKKAVKINEKGGKDEFLDTKPEDVELKQYKPEDSKLIKSHLPYRNSLKIGASSLKSKPVRLVFTIFLCMVSFALFGLADTMGAYDKVTTYEKSIMDTRVEGAAFVKQKLRSSGGNYTYKEDTQLNDDDIAKINADSGVKVVPVYSGGRYSNGYSFVSSLNKPALLENDNGYAYYSGKVSGFTDVTEEIFNQTGLTLTQGSALPTVLGEIAIPSYVYEHFTYAGLVYTDPLTNEKVTLAADQIKSPADVIGKYINFGNNSGGNGMPFKITGVVETNFDNSRYGDYMPGAQKVEANMLDMVVTRELETKLKYSYHSLCFTAPGTVALLIAADSQEMSKGPTIGKDINYSGHLSLQSANSGRGYNYIAKLSQLNDKSSIVWTNGEKTSLSENEIIVPVAIGYNVDGSSKYDNNLSAETVDYIMTTFGLTEDQRDYLQNDVKLGFVVDTISGYVAEKYVNENGYPNTEAFRNYVTEQYGEATEDNCKQVYKSYLSYNSRYNDKSGFVRNEFGGPSGNELLLPYVKTIYGMENVTTDIAETGDIVLQSNTSGEYRSEKYTVVGYYYPSAETTGNFNQNGDPIIDYSSSSSLIFVSDANYDFFEADEAGYYSFAIGKMPYDDAAAVKKIVGFNYTAHNGNTYYTLTNEVSFMLDTVNDMVEMLAQVFLYVGIFFAVFAALMMFNFISVSISYKKREIGILRAVGARSSDVFGIFFNESLIITLINFVLASVVTFVTTTIINGVIRSEYGFALTLLNVGLRQFALILGVGVLVAFIASFIPVMRIAKKRPIDAIQNR